MRPWSIATIVASLLLLTSCSSFCSKTSFIYPSRCQLGRTLDLELDVDSDKHFDDNRPVVIDQFISKLQQSLDDETFESFLLKGPSVPRKKKKSNTTNDTLEQQKEKLRGKYKTISGRLVLLQEKKRRKGKKNETKDTLYVQCTIKYHLATDVAKNWRVVGKDDNIEQQNEVEVGLRQLFGHDGAPLSEWGAQNNINGELGILSGELVTSNGIYKLQLQPNSSFKLSQKVLKKSSTQQQVLSHDRSKNVPLDPSSLFLQKLGVSNKDGKPISGMSSKLRQCQKFVEIVGTIVNSNSNNKPSKIRVIDMGCGRGYLTFSLHSYLYNKFGSTSTSTQDKNNAVSIETKGIDRRPKLIAEINGIAQSLGDGFNNLKFVEGTIGTTNNLFRNDSLQQNEQTDNSLDILIALHACDTATDDSLWFAIDRDVDIIVTAPCCQHELRPQIDKHTSNNPSHPLSEILRHAIYRERATETVTDSMRAILLEIAGYDVNVFEFIGKVRVCVVLCVLWCVQYDYSAIRILHLNFVCLYVIAFASRMY